MLRRRWNGWREGRRHAVAILLLALAAAGCFLQRRGSEATLATETVEQRDISVTIEASGTVEPIDLVEVKSKAAGQILKMPVEVGSVVREGDLLAQIDTVDVKNSYAQAAAAARAAEAKWNVSRSQLDRAERLFAEGVITAEEHESAQLDNANADAALVKAKTDLDTARQRRDDATVRAPIAGTILEQLVSKGQVISSATSSVSGGTTLLNMADLRRIRIRALVSETDIGSVRAGQGATVSVEAFPEREFAGTVEKVEPQAVVEQSVTMFPVLVSITNEDGRLLPGMNGEVSFLVSERNGVVAVPLEAVRTVRELSSIAAALGVDAEAVRAQLASQEMTGTPAASSPSATPADSLQAMRQQREELRSRRAERGRGGNAFASFGGPPPDGMGPPPDGMGPPPDGMEPPPGVPAGRSEVASPGGDLAVGVTTTARTVQLTPKTQFVFISTDEGLEPRVVTLGLSDFDYAQVLSGITAGQSVALLNISEMQAKRTAEQSKIKERMGTGIPGASSTKSSGK